MRKKQNLPGLGEYLLRLSTELECGCARLGIKMIIFVVQ